MGLEKIELHNKGMSRDLSISKESNEFAYENHNIRIQSTDNETLLSVTNVKGPKKMNLTIWRNGNQQQYTDIQGSIIGRCLAGDYLVLFALDKSNYFYPAKIYRVNLKTIKEDSQGDFSCDVVVLYSGSNTNLKFSTDQHLDTLFYYEAFNIQKVYWTNGWNDNPRVINITKGETDNVGHNTYYTSDDDFAFYPQIKKVPTIEVEKQRTQLSRLPVGVIQYFVSYFNSNGAETLVANATSLLSVDLEGRGAPADTTTNDCSFKVTLSNVDTQFDYVRVYSAIRTSSEAAVNAYIVRDIKIDKNNSAATYSFVDNGTNNEAIQDSQLMFIGGQPFFAKTLTQKDDTIFFGNLKTERKYLDAKLKEALHPATGTTTPKINLSFGTKTFTPKSPEINAFYPYRLQKDLPSIDYRTFKTGETYRFGIQFQDKQGVWSDVEWVGDLEQTTFPSYNETTGKYTVASAKTTGLDDSIKNLASNQGYINYRLLMADPRFSNGRKILAQGIVCPTMFNAAQRAAGSVYAFPSWVMRPNGGPLPHHHLEALDSPEEARDTAEVQYDNTHEDNSNSRVYNTPDIDISQSENFYITIMGVGGLRKLFYAVYRIYPSSTDNPRDYINTNLFKNVGTSSSPSFEPVVIKRVGSGSSATGNCELVYGNWFTDGTWGQYLDTIKTVLGTHAEDYPLESLPTVSELVKLASGINAGAQPVKAVLKAAMEGILPEGVKYSDDRSFDGVTTRLAERNWCRWGGFQNHYSDNHLDHHGSAKCYTFTSSVSSVNHKNFMFFADSYEPDREYSGRKWFLYPYPTPYTDGDDIKKDIPFVLPEALNQAIAGSGTQYLVHNFSDINDPDNPPDTNCAFNGELKNKQIFVQVVFPGLYGKKGSGDFFIDSSIISMHSPEIIDNPSLFVNKNCKFNIVGLTEFKNSYADINTEFETPPYISDRGGFDDSFLYKYRTALEYNPLVSDYFYIDGKFNEIQSEGQGTGKWILTPANASKYKIFLFNQGKSIIGATNQDFLPAVQYGDGEDVKPEPISILYGTLKSKTIFNHQFTHTEYIDYRNRNNASLKYTPDFVEYVDNNFVPVERNLNSLYQGNLDTLIASDDVPIIIYPNSKSAKQFGSSVRIKFDSTQHIVLDLGKTLITEKYYILPKLNSETSYEYPDSTNPSGFYAKRNFGELWGDSWYALNDVYSYNNYYQLNIGDVILSTSYPYLYIGEIVQEINQADLYGGISDGALKKLIWIPISETTPLNGAVTKTDGDTYYQRWDCLKTYPSTEEDLNKVVDITSFMVESHINLDERTDRNRGNFNIMSRPINFNLFNPVYSQLNNLFSYSIEGNELTTETYPTQYTWSLIKNKNALVDSWTNVTLTSLGTCKYPITKLDTFNHNILALTEHSIEQIAFNARTMVQTDGLPVEILNSSKVTGTIQLQYPYGTYNMSTLITEQGLYFIEDNDKSIIRIGLDGAFKKLGVTTMGDWFKNNITQGTYTPDFTEPFHMEYDSIHKDVYFVNSKYCLVYNETLDSFTSFMDYTNMDVLYNYGGNTYAIALNGNHIMFEGKYNTTFNEQPIGYSVEYRINTKPLEDKVFTNLDFIADNETVNTEPFDYIHAWNEYQDTTNVSLVYLRNMPSNFKQKFRVWRADIPRDGNKKLAGNRLRNPWLNFKLSKSTNNLPNELMTFHNITVQYLR